MSRFGLLTLVAVLAWPSFALAGGSNGSSPSTPISVPGTRVVDIRTSSGGVARYTTIPGNSAFATHGGSGKPCSFVATTDGTTSDQQHYVSGQTVISGRWLFLEGKQLSQGEADPNRPFMTNGPLSKAVRSFFIFCDTVQHAIGFILVGPGDPLLDPHARLTQLYNGLQLERPVVYRNPVVDRWGGLITRYPAWLAIQPSAWRPQTSNVIRYRGWQLALQTQPATMQFQVHFVPDPTQPSPAFNGIVDCVGPSGAQADAVAFPAMPALPEQTEPGVNGPCMWTPPGPGTVTIEARITYHVTFWVTGYTEPLPDYVWTSAPVTFTTGELSAVNTNG